MKIYYFFYFNVFKISSLNDDQVRNEAADDFLSLLKEWAKLCQYFSIYDTDKVPEQSLNFMSEEEEEEEEEENDDDANVPNEEFEVERLIAVCYGDPNKTKKPGVYFKVYIFDIENDQSSWTTLFSFLLFCLTFGYIVFSSL